MAERLIEANGVELCTESFGDTTDSRILLIMGIGASMLWWEDDFCRMLADGGRFVIRYDHRDTGRSVTYERGRPGYTGSDLVADGAGVLDAYGIPSAHVVGVSGGGAIAQLLALDHPERVLSLVLISTSPALPVGRELPGPTEAFGRFVSTAEADWSDAGSVIDYLVDYARVLVGSQRAFDEGAVRDLVRRDVERACDFAAVQNHDSLPEDGPATTTSVITRGSDARDPRHRRPDVPARAWRSSRRGDPARDAVARRGRGSRPRSTGLELHRPRDSRTHGPQRIGQLDRARSVARARTIWRVPAPRRAGRA